MKDALYARPDVQRLCEAFSVCKDKKELYAFMRDLMTETEIDEFAHRLTAAVMLYDGKSYDAVAAETAMSTTTIARVSKWLQQGTDGYKTVLARIQHHTPKKNTRSGVSLK
jgi:TrpR-related protein YerC/YecD